MTRLRTALVAIALTAATVAPLDADLKYTMRIATEPSSVPSAGPQHPLMAMIGGIVAGTMAPEGGLEITVTMGQAGSRVEYSRAYTVVPEGGVTLMRPDGTMIVLDTANRTYWRMARPDASAFMPPPDVTVTRTGDFEVITGIRAERATLQIRVPLPVPAEQLPEGMPSEFIVTGEAWLADAFREYARLTATMTGMASFGLEKLAAEGLPMRSVIRGEMFGDRQVASVVTAISEVAVPASAFDIPAGYTEVPPPAAMAALPR